MASDANVNSSSSNTPMLILLLLNLLLTAFLMAHVVYYVPEGRFHADEDASAVAGDDQSGKPLSIDAVGLNSGGDGVVMELMTTSGGDAKKLQSISLSQEEFLQTLDRMNLFRERLEEADLIRKVE